MDFSRNAKHCTVGKQIPNKKSVIWTVGIRYFNLNKKFW